MKRSSSFTLIELLVVLAVISSLLAISITGISRFKSSLEYRSSVDQVLSDVRLAQQLADSTSDVCRIDFKAGKNVYSVSQNGSIVRNGRVSNGVQFYGKSYFSFVPSGYTDVGGSGTLFLGGSASVKKIIVSSRGRIRVE